MRADRLQVKKVSSHGRLIPRRLDDHQFAGMGAAISLRRREGAGRVRVFGRHVGRYGRAARHDRSFRLLFSRAKIRPKPAYAAFFSLGSGPGNGAISASEFSVGREVSFPSMISVKATSASPIPGRVTTSGRCPRFNWRTRRETTFTKSSERGITFEAATRRFEFIDMMGLRT